MFIQISGEEVTNIIKRYVFDKFGTALGAKSTDDLSVQTTDYSEIKSIKVTKEE